MENVLITGASGYIGSKLAGYLAGQDEIRRIVGIDIHPPRLPCDKLLFHRRDVRAPVTDLLQEHRIDTVIHSAFILAPLHDKALMEDVNVNGTLNVLDCAVRSGVRQFLYTSSSTAYGFHPDNETPLTEESPLRGNGDFTYSKTKREIELALKSWQESGDHDMILTIIRPCFVVGPGFTNPLARHLGKRFVLLPSGDQPLQYVHEDDLIEIIYRLLCKKKRGAYNVGADGTISFNEMIRLLGNIHLTISFPLMYFLNHFAWHLRLSAISAFPSPALNMIRYSWGVSSEKLKRELDYRYRYTTAAAFADYAAHVKSVQTLHH
jgi:UDP-glucose 4-epimerase